MSLPATTLDRPKDSLGDLSAAPSRLIQALHDLARAQDLSSVQEIAVRSARQIAQADGATFVLREGDSCHYLAEDAIAPLWKGRHFPLNECVSGWAMSQGRPAVVGDIAEDPRVPYELYEPTFVKSLLIVPIGLDEPVAAIGIYWAVRHVATEAETASIQALATSIAAALENVQRQQTLQDRLAERTRQLEGTMGELETFSYSVAHDLQAPLRHISSYGELILESSAGVLDDEAKGWLGRIKASGAQMTELIQALLGLATYMRAELAPIQVDLSALAREQAELLCQADPERHVQFEIEEGLCVHADEAHMRVLLQSLLGNAWKFTAKRELACIRFGRTPQPDGVPVYFVGDDGVGFDMRYTGKLFAPFQRLHRAKDFPGLGIGLATARRIVHRHGGSIWADAATDQGATFFFTLKDAPAPTLPLRPPPATAAD